MPDLRFAPGDPPISAVWHERGFVDVDEYHAFICDLAGPHDRRQLERGAFHCRVRGGSVGMAAVASVSSNRPMWLRTSGPRNTVYLHMLRHGRTEYEFAEGSFTAGSGQAVVIAPGDAYESTQRACRTDVLSIDAGALARERAERRSDEDDAPVDLPRSLDLTTVRGRMLVELVSAVRLVLERGEPLRPDLDRLVVGAFVDAIDAAGARGAASQVSRPSPRASEALARFALFVDANLDRTLTLGDLCAAARIPARTLQRLCLAEWGCSPSRFVVERRLDRVRRLLDGAGPTRSVTDAALACGFTHLGRFAAAYRVRFGELPSTTLSRRRARCRRSR